MIKFASVTSVNLVTFDYIWFCFCFMRPRRPRKHLLNSSNSKLWSAVLNFSSLEVLAINRAGTWQIAWDIAICQTQNQYELKSVTFILKKCEWEHYIVEFKSLALQGPSKGPQRTALLLFEHHLAKLNHSLTCCFRAHFDWKRNISTSRLECRYTAMSYVRHPASLAMFILLATAIQLWHRPKVL